MPTQCTDVDKFIPTYLDGELAESELHSFEHHLSECEKCAAEVEGERAFLDRIRTALATPPAPDTFRARLNRTLDAEDEAEHKATLRERSAWILPGAATVAAAAALVVFTLDIAQPAQNQNRAEADVTSSAPLSASRDIARSAREYLRMPVRAPRFANAEASLRGWQPIRNRNHDAALLVYEVKLGKERFRLEIQTLDARNLDLRGAERRVVRGTPVWVASAMGMNAVSIRDENGIGYVFTSYMDSDALVNLVVRSDLVERVNQQLKR